MKIDITTNSEAILSIQVSSIAYMHKPKNSEYATMTWHRSNVSPKELYDLCCKGHTFRCNLESTRTKDKRVFVNSSFVAFDYDHSIYDMETMIDVVPIKPTFGYTSFSKCDDDGNHKFRLVYVFDQPITNDKEWKYISHQLGDAIGFGDDKKSYEPTSIWNGTRNGGVFLGNVYRKPQVDKSLLEGDSFPSTSNLSKAEKEALKRAVSSLKKTPIYKCFNSVDDLYEVYDKFKTQYKLYEESLPVTENATHYEFDKRTYVHLMRKFKVSESGRPYIGKWEKGDHRHNYIYADVKMLMLIKPDITLEEVLFNMCHEIGMFFDCTRLSKSKMLSNIYQAYTDGKPFEYRGKRRSVRMKKGYIYSKVMSSIKKQACLESYDCNLTLTQNITLLKDLGINVTRQTLSKYIVEEGLTLKQPHFKASYKPKSKH